MYENLNTSSEDLFREHLWLIDVRWVNEGVWAQELAPIFVHGRLFTSFQFEQGLWLLL